MQGMAALLTVGSLLALAGCASELDECRKAYPTTSSAAYKACFRAALQHQSEEMDRQLRLDFKGKD